MDVTNPQHPAAMIRYAVYFAPPPGPLAAAAARWLGRDAETGARLEQPHPALAGLTRQAARYGFHATLRAPFRPHPGLAEADLVEALDALAAALTPVTLAGLRLASLDGFLALVPEGDETRLNALAATVVERFQPFAAPLTEAEIARRNPAALTPQQRAYLDRWGYPHVFDAFRFHMTLTDRLSTADAAILGALAQAMVADRARKPFPVDALVLFAEGADGLFHHRHRASLR